MIENHHISDDRYLEFQQDRLDEEERIRFLMHISQCDYCSEKLAGFLEADMVSAPPDMKINILTASKKADVRFVKNAVEMTKRMQLFLYSLKVGAATIGAFIILLLFINGHDFSNVPKNIEVDIKKQSNTFSITNMIRESTNSLSDNLFNFSNEIIKMEDRNHDK